MRKAWFSAAEIAAEGLPGIPHSEAELADMVLRYGQILHVWFTIEELRASRIKKFTETYLDDLAWSFPILLPDYARHCEANSANEFHISLFEAPERAALLARFNPGLRVVA